MEYLFSFAIFIIIFFLGTLWVINVLGKDLDAYLRKIIQEAGDNEIPVKPAIDRAWDNVKLQEDYASMQSSVLDDLPDMIVIQMHKIGHKLNQEEAEMIAKFVRSCKQ